jgi:STAS-like domain of unknown function (DUF4325)
MRYMILELIGENCMTQQSGERIYDKIHPLLLAGQPVELDFAGAKRFLSVFFNFAIGQLLRDIEPDVLDRILTVSNLTPVGQQTYERVIDNAKRYYALDEHGQESLDAIVVEQAALL